MHDANAPTWIVRIVCLEETKDSIYLKIGSVKVSRLAPLFPHQSRKNATPLVNVSKATAVLQADNRPQHQVRHIPASHAISALASL